MISLHLLVKNVDLSNAESLDEVCSKINAMDVSSKKTLLFVYHLCGYVRSPG